MPETKTMKTSYLVDGLSISNSDPKSKVHIEVYQHSTRGIDTRIAATCKNGTHFFYPPIKLGPSYA